MYLPRTAVAATLGAVVATAALQWWRSEPGAGYLARDRSAYESRAAAAAPASDASETDQNAASVAAFERRLAHLEVLLQREVALNAELRERLESISARLPEGAGGLSAAADGTYGTGSESPPMAVLLPEDPLPDEAETQIIDENKSAMQRALEAAGVDPGTAEAIKRRGDELAMSEMYLRDQATREGWLNSPRFEQEMAAIQEQQTSLREELGEDLYDRYLFAQGRPNRIIVNDVMFHSVAEQVGLKPGDLITRYGDAFLFAPDELVAQTQGGPAGEMVKLEVNRAGSRFEVEVPRGPLGLRIGPAQDHPDSG